jgi:hypothetical protein
LPVKTLKKLKLEHPDFWKSSHDLPTSWTRRIPPRQTLKHDTVFRFSFFKFTNTMASATAWTQSARQPSKSSESFVDLLWPGQNEIYPVLAGTGWMLHRLQSRPVSQSLNDLMYHLPFG